MRKLLAALVLLVLCSLLVPRSANAHVLITDTAGHTGAVLHISPDDDPIAGEESSLFFDIQDKSVSQDTHSFSLSITPSGGTTTLAPISVRNNTVSSSYVFPHQGVYAIVLALEPRQGKGATLRFEYTQRVARGTIMTTAAQQPIRHDWALAGLIASLCTLAGLVIVGFNNRKAIVVHSKQ